MMFRHVGRVFGYPMDSCVLIQFRGDEGPVYVFFSEAVPLKMGGSSPQLSGDTPIIIAVYFSLTVGMLG
jgi:hypothetical protein